MSNAVERPCNTYKIVTYLNITTYAHVTFFYFKFGLEVPTCFYENKNSLT